MIPRLLLAAFTGLTLTFAHVQAGELPNETPAEFTPKTDSFDYEKREAMIPMRDGIKLFTVILIPKGAKHWPILLTRTPYGAGGRLNGHASAHLSEIIGVTDIGDELILSGGYIRVEQDIRGKHGSEGDYVMTRPLKGPLNGTEVDHATDTWDTIDWLVKNIPESNGKVGIYGISYDGFTSLMALFHPHPALKAAMPINAMVDGWMGDDWFHNGAFRQDSLTYAHDQQATRGSDIHWWSGNYDQYAEWLEAGSAGNMARLHGLDGIGFAQKLMAHPAYDDFWQNQAIDKLLAKEGITVPTMLVHSLWDQEDIYGNLAVWKAVKPKDKDNKLFLVMGPWFHHQQRLKGDAIGKIEWGADQSLYFRRHLVKPFFDHFLKDEAPPLDIPTVAAFESGTNQWLSLKSWPIAGETRPLFLQPGGRLAAAKAEGFDDYVSDPAKPIPFLPRPINIEKNPDSWSTWLVSDQRDAASRTDVLVYEGEVLTAPMKIAGNPVADLMVSTTGTDGDFVVKLIDVYPPEIGRQPEMGGYEFMVSGDIFRGRYRDSLSNPKPFVAGEKAKIRFNLPAADHVFLPGHRIMVQIQSSWFPLYDRNPQTYVENIFFAKPGDYKKATIRVFGESKVELPVVRK